METVISRDGTRIAFDRVGAGPTVILVGGALSIRPAAGPLVELLGPHFTVVTCDRRGRGDSGDTPPYAADREIEDIAALPSEHARAAALSVSLRAGCHLGVKVAEQGSEGPRIEPVGMPLEHNETRVRGRCRRSWRCGDCRKGGAGPDGRSGHGSRPLVPAQEPSKWQARAQRRIARPARCTGRSGQRWTVRGH